MTAGRDEKRMKLRYAGTCRVCGAALAARTDAVYGRVHRVLAASLPPA